QMGIRSSEGDLIHQVKMRSLLAFLMNEVDTSYDKPTAAEYAMSQELRNEAAPIQEGLNKLISGSH
ncbi:MAG TPA: hypothetical protein VGN11_03480, partial [Candidatus Baltobacteraceae bacterium]|nr:hypothetical protein [Candidatus Baltobacteraceae bacterium]